MTTIFQIANRMQAIIIKYLACFFRTIYEIIIITILEIIGLKDYRKPISCND